MPEAPADAARAGVVPGLRYPIEAVLFDFHGTVAQVEDPVDWVSAAARECGVRLDRVLATALADRLFAVGLAGGPPPTRVPPELAQVFAERDLTPAAHRAAYVGLAATVDSGIDGLADALYDRLLRPEGWRAYAETVPTLSALHEAGVPVGVVSNVGFDIRELGAALGFARYVSDWTLSFEVGCCKPDPTVFRHACRSLGATPERTLMVGNSADDAGAATAGCPTLVLPTAPPGAANGLRAVLTFTLS